MFVVGDLVRRMAAFHVQEGGGFDGGWHWFLIRGAYWRRTESVPSKQKANRSVGFVECFTRGILVGREGIEPSTNGLRVRCSTN